MEEYMSRFKAGAGEGNSSTRSDLRSQSSPQTQRVLIATGSLSSIFASGSTPSSLSAAISLSYLSVDASSVLGTSKEHVHDDNAGERFTSSETKNNQSFASASAHGTDLPHLQLGDPGTLADMRPAEVNLSEIDRLQVHDYAFISRTRDK